MDLAHPIGTYFADDAIVRVMDSTCIAHGRTAILAMLGGWLEGNRHFRLEILAEHALGPIVVNLRHDITFSPGAPAHTGKIASVFVLSDGRIKEWSDYVMG